MTMTRLTAVSSTEIPEPQQGQAAQPGAEAIQIATQMMTMALKALSQRAVVALANLFTLLTATSAFYLWYIALPTLDNVKIAGLTIYAAFILLLNIYGRRT